MQAKDLFYQLQQLEKEMKTKQLLAQTYREIAEGVRSPNVSDMPKNPSVNTTLLSDMIVKAIELDAEVETTRTEVTQLKASILGSIMQLDVMYQEILIQRYFNKREWAFICQHMCYSKSGIFKLHSLALDALTQKITQEWS